MNAPAMSPDYRPTFFIGGPMHAQWFSVPETDREVAMRFSRALTFSPLGRDRYTRRKFFRIVGLEEIEVAYLMAHEDWLDEDLPASIIPDTAWRKAEDEELA